MSICTEERSRQANVYRRAARKLERDLDDYACNAIYAAACRKPWTYPPHRDNHPLVAAFNAIYKPDYARPDQGYLENRDHRIVALCFMAAIVEREAITR